MMELTLEESLSMSMAEIAKRHDEQSNLIKDIQSSTDFALRNQKASIKSLEIQVRKISIILHERLFGNLQSSIEIKPRVNDETISTFVKVDKPLIHHIDASQYAHRRNQVKAFIPTIEEGEGMDEPIINDIETKFDNIGSNEDECEYLVLAGRQLEITVYAACSLNEYRVYDKGINTTYPGEWIRRIDFLYSLRNLKKTDSDILYAGSIKEDTAYLCLHFAEDHEGTRSNTPYPENSILRIQDIEGEYSGRYQTWSLNQEIPNMPTRSLVEHLSTDLVSTYKGLMEKTYTWIEAREVETNGAPSDRSENLERSNKSFGKITEDRKAGTSSPLIEELIMDFFLACPKSQEKSLPHKRSQIEEVVRTGQLSYLVKGIKKERANAFENQQVKGKKDKGTTPNEAPILMIRQWELEMDIQQKNEKSSKKG
ncbi:hypothetical protein Tco_0013577 [Tanacetum coccineum]